MEKMRVLRLLCCLALIIPWLTGCQGNAPTPSPTLPPLHADCIRQVLGDAEVMAGQELNVDQDEELELVVLYISEAKDYKPIRVLILETAFTECRAVGDEQLTLTALATGERLSTRIRTIEVIELTGDNQPELHIYLDQPGRDEDDAEYHAILTPKDGEWKHVLGNTGIAQNPSLNLFEYRDAPEGEAKDIYLKRYSYWTGETRYIIMRWDGSRFMPIEGDLIEVEKTPPLWAQCCCVGVLIIPAGLIALVLIQRQKRKRMG